MKLWICHEAVAISGNTGAWVEESKMLFISMMSLPWEAGEWPYKDLKQNFTNNDFRCMLKVWKAPIDLMYITLVVLWNFKVCSNHGQKVTS